MEFIDLGSQYCALKGQIDKNIETVLKSSQFIGGQFVDALEHDLAAYVGRKHCITCGNGTDALQLAYMAYSVGPGDAVFCPDMTFVASVEPAAMFGATPVFCDIDMRSYNIDPASLVSAVEQVRAEGVLDPKAVVVVDFLGNPADMDALTVVCDEYDLVMIEDAAQGMGGSYKGRKLGSFGDVAATSFFPSKPLGCYGDGGAVFTDDDSIAELMRSLKVHGKGASKYDNVRVGFNSRLDNLQAAVLVAKLEKLDEEIAIRQEVAKRYDEALGDLLVTPHIEPNCVSAYAQYIVLAENELRRSRMMDALKGNDIPSLLYYPNAISTMPGYAAFPHELCPCAIAYSERNVGLPFSPYLTEQDQYRVIDAVRECI